MSIILASASPRRQELMHMITDDFTVMPSDADETLDSSVTSDRAASVLASRKAHHIARTHPDDTVIGCDTIVTVDGLILGKPRDAADAHRMLSLLSGRTHSVITGVSVIHEGREENFSEETKVTFYPLSDKQIRDYIMTGDPMDKAGAYGIQTEGALLVEKIDGDFFNVVGLPVARLYRRLMNDELL
ncbi:MAG: septum formation protein Maf [Oscillospiraceae bacterium]|nr:septum formation protein Maf [Oscillospiraceae bacterium]